MGFSASWLGVRGRRATDVLAELGLVETSSKEWMPESEIVGTSLSSGWYVVFFNDISPEALKPESLRRLSKGGELIACQIEEHAMVSTAAQWLDGQEIWFVAHDSEDGLDNLETTGQLPPSFESIRDLLQSKQNGETGVDYIFDVPVELAASVAGFRHDHAFDETESESFVVLERKG